MPEIAFTGGNELRSLGPRELQVILLASDGLTDKQIARRLALSAGTVTSLWANVRKKLSIHTRVAAVARTAWATALLHNRLIEWRGASHEDAALVLTRKLVLLTCNQAGASQFAVHCGETFKVEPSQLSDLTGASIEADGLPWLKALRDGKPVTRCLLLRLETGDVHPHQVTCEPVTDAAFGNLVVVRIRKAEGHFVVAGHWLDDDCREAYAKAANDR